MKTRGRYNKLSSYATTIGQQEGATVVTYHRTAIVSFTAETVTLRSGGWKTVTTKRKMNQAARQFGLGYRVDQTDFEWSVSFFDGRPQIEFEDGMTFPRGKELA